MIHKAVTTVIQRNTTSSRFLTCMLCSHARMCWALGPVELALGPTFTQYLGEKSPNAMSASEVKRTSHASNHAGAVLYAFPEN